MNKIITSVVRSTSTNFDSIVDDLLVAAAAAERAGDKLRAAHLMRVAEAVDGGVSLAEAASAFGIAPVVRSWSPLAQARVHNLH